MNPPETNYTCVMVDNNELDRLTLISYIPRYPFIQLAGAFEAAAAALAFIEHLVHFLQLQKDSPDLMTREQAAVHRQNISESAEDLLNNMETMLLWSKEQMENIRPDIRTIPVAGLFEYIEKFFAQVKTAHIRLDAVPGLLLSTDENYLRTIMQNLTSNAIRALKTTPDGQIAWKAKEEQGTIY